VITYERFPNHDNTRFSKGGAFEGARQLPAMEMSIAGAAFGLPILVAVPSESFACIAASDRASRAML
jgi:hypothetical protein